MKKIINSKFELEKLLVSLGWTEEEPGSRFLVKNNLKYFKYYKEFLYEPAFGVYYNIMKLQNLVKCPLEYDTETGLLTHKDFLAIKL